MLQQECQTCLRSQIAAVAASWGKAYACQSFNVNGCRITLTATVCMMQGACDCCYFGQCMTSSTSRNIRRQSGEQLKLTWWIMRRMVAGSRKTMPASPSTARGSDWAFVLRPGAPMLSASVFSLCLFLAAPPRRIFTAGANNPQQYFISETSL